MRYAFSSGFRLQVLAWHRIDAVFGAHLSPFCMSITAWVLSCFPPVLIKVLGQAEENVFVEFNSQMVAKCCQFSAYLVQRRPSEESALFFKFLSFES